MGFFLVGAIFLHGGEGGAEVEGVGGGGGEGFAVGGEVVAVGEGDDGEADEGFFVGAEFGVGDDGGAVGGAGEGDGVVWLEVVACRFLCGGKEEFDDDGVGCGFIGFPGFDEGLGADGEAGVEEVGRGEFADVGDDEVAFDVGGGGGFLVVGEVVALPDEVVGVEALVLERKELGEGGFGIGGVAVGAFLGGEFGDGRKALEFPQDLVVLWALGVVEDVEAGGPTDDREGSGKKVGEEPPKERGGLPDEILDVLFGHGRRKLGAGGAVEGGVGGRDDAFFFGFEGGAATTGAGRVGIDDLESDVVEVAGVVDVATAEVFVAVGGEKDADALLLDHSVLGFGGPDFHDVLEACAAASLDAEAEAIGRGGVLGREEGSEFLNGVVGEGNHGRWLSAGKMPQGGRVRQCFFCGRLGIGDWRLPVDFAD